MLLLQVKEELVKMRNEHSGELWKGVHHASTLHVSTTHKLIFIRVHEHTLMISKHAAKLFWIWTINTNSLKTDGKAITYSIRYESLFQFIALMCLYYESLDCHWMMWIFNLLPLSDFVFVINCYLQLWTINKFQSIL